LADEYANLYERYGHWKDTAIRLEGEAVYSLTVTFLQMWETESNQKEDYEAYRPVLNEPIPDHGFYQPFNDGPVNHPSNPAESISICKTFAPRANKLAFPVTRSLKRAPNTTSKSHSVNAILEVLEPCMPTIPAYSS
jgi:phosphatidylserine/phosphatidylglycerophosphate/cardiolipin synthase-like enzyme